LSRGYTDVKQQSDAAKPDPVGNLELMSTLFRILLFLTLGGYLLPGGAWGTPPYGDPNQPYDRLPGSLKTRHVKWAHPAAGGPLKALFILPYRDAREVVELAQRLQLDYTVIMNAGHTAWERGYSEGVGTTPLTGVEAKIVLDRVVQQRLSLSQSYDVIVIGKVSWEVMPGSVRERILEHAARGSGLVYVTPHRLKPGYNNRTNVATGQDAVFHRLFETTTDQSLASWIQDALPLDTLPIHMIDTHQRYKPLPGIPLHESAQATMCVTTSQHGKGRVVGLDYFDETTARRHSNSLTPYWNDPQGIHDWLAYDFTFSILTRCILWSANRQPQAQIAISITTPTNKLHRPTDKELRRLRWHDQSPQTVVARQPDGRVRIVSMTGPHQAAFVDYNVRSRNGTVLEHDRLPWSASIERAIPKLARGDYLIDIRLLDTAGAVIDSASRSFRVETEQRIAELTIDRPWYQAHQQIAGKLRLAKPLSKNHSIDVRAVDTWGRTVATAPIQVDPEGRAVFSIPVRNPLSELWDITCRVRDQRGVIDSLSVPAAIPNRVFDDYMFMLIFCPTPGRSHWKGDLYGRLMREHGINSTYTYLIYNQQHQFVNNARHHLRSVAYAEHHGELLSPADRNRDPQREQPDLDLAELSRMLRHVAQTGQKLNPDEFPFRMQYLGADFINARIDQYKLAAGFGSPYYTLTGENYLSGEFDGRENSGFGATTTRVFQAWCREQYADDLSKLNAEWNTKFTAWKQVRGVMLNEAVERNQLPRWVDFRHFMRSRVWSQYFIDWTRMMRRFIPDARTGRVGHDHHDFSRYRNEMTCSKLYIGQEKHAQWRHAMTVELPQSFSRDRSFLLAPQSVLRWNYDHQLPVHRERYPWLILMLGLNGFDWENCLSNSPLGGLSCFTPDFSETLPFFEDYSREVRTIQRGLGKLTIAAKPHRSQVAMLWSPYNHYISRLLPFENNGFSGTWMSNVSVIGGAPADALTLLNSIRIRPTIVAPEDLGEGGLAKRGFRAIVLPYNKGMSAKEAEAIRAFVKGGGLALADNEPGTYSEHGRKLKQSRLADLFPITHKYHVQQIGRGRAVYLPNLINNYTNRLESEDFNGSELVARLLDQFAEQQPPVELIGQDGQPRRDVFARMFTHGTTQLLGLLCSDTQSNHSPRPTTLQLPDKRYVYDVRNTDFLGFNDRLDLSLDLKPRFLAIVPARFESIKFNKPVHNVEAGTNLKIKGTIGFNDPQAAQDVSQAVHVRVFDSQSRELEWFRQNVVFAGTEFNVHLPLALSIAPGRYRVSASHALTGMQCVTHLNVRQP